MGLRVTAPSSTSNLVTLSSVRLRILGDATDATEDTLLGELIAEASAGIQTYLWPVARQTYEWRTGGTGNHELMLPRWPVDSDSITVTEIDEAGDTIASGTTNTDWTVKDAAAGLLFLDTGWTRHQRAFLEDAEERWVTVFKGGWVLPDQVSTWATSQTWVLGEWVKPTAATPAKTSRWLFEVTTGGASDSTEPDWSTATDAGDTITDNAATLTARDAVELPDALRSLCHREIYRRYQQVAVAPGITREQVGNVSTDYARPSEIGGILDPVVERGLNVWKDRVAS